MANASRARCALKTFALVGIDLSVTCIFLSWHGTTFSPRDNFIVQFSQTYSFFHATIDFLILSIIRSILVVTGCIMMFAQAPELAFTQLHYASLCICILFCCFSPTKLLALSDDSDPSVRPVVYIGDWLVFVQNCVFSMIAHSILGGFTDARKRSAVPQATSTTANGGTSLTAGTTTNYVPLQNSFGDDESVESSEPSEDGVKVGKTMRIICRLLEYCKNEWIWHLSGFFWLFTYSLTRIFVPYYTGQVIASVVSTSGDKYVALIDSVKLMILISVVSAVAGGLRGGSFEYAYARINRAVRFDLFSSLVRQDVAFFDAHKTGEITSRLTADTQTMSDTVALNINIFVRNMVQMGGSMIFMMTLCWKLSMIPFIIVPIILMASKIFGVYYDILSERTQEAIARSNDVSEEVLSTIRTVRSFACEDEEARRYYAKLTDTLHVTRSKAFAYVGYMWVSELFQAVINIAVLWYGGHLVLTNQLNKDLLVSFLLYQMQLADNIRQLGEVWTGLMQSVGASRKVFEYIDRTPEIDTSGTLERNVLRGRIEFNNVHFSYPTRPNNPVLKGLTFTVEPGEIVALVGPSGGGKSSCIALIEHFYRPTSGKVLIDGADIGVYEHHFIHNKIALVGQEPVLFARSVAENIAYGLEGTTMTDVMQAAKMANAHSFIVKTRDRYETNVGEKGSQMSGGQKQRIAIARALIRQPNVLLLDEATSALDTESEHLVQEAIYSNLNGRSVILIAHRLSTVEKADKIVLINKGRVEQMGTHQELFNQEGMYRQLVQRQMIAGADDVGTQPLPPSLSLQSVTLDGEEDASLSPHPGGSASVMSISPRGNPHSLLATSFSQSLSSLQSK